MNTERSERKVRAFLKNRQYLRRKTVTVERTFSSSREDVFGQLCPARELDWIEGWDCELIYTSTGYVEEGCIFTTPGTNALGVGLWIITAHQPNEMLEAVTITDDSLVEHFTIRLTTNRDGTTTGVWNMTFTALNETGNGILESMPDDAPDLKRALDGLEHFLRTGDMLTG